MSDTKKNIINWQWHDIPEMVSLFVHLLALAQHGDYKWRGRVINRGQLVTSRARLAELTGISAQSIRTCLSRLESTNEITKQSTNRNSIITICDFDSWRSQIFAINQLINQQSNQQPTNHQTILLNNNNNIYIAVAETRARTREQAFSPDGMAKWCKALAIDEVTYCTLAEQVFAEWDATDEQDPSVDHFRNTMRIKVEVWRKQQRQLERERNGAETPLERRKRAEREAMAAAAMDINNVINSKKWN